MHPTPPAELASRDRLARPMEDRQLDVLGVGIGPANLSVAALLAPLSDRGAPSLRAEFFDRQPEFRWHPGFLFPEATIQNSFLKDLVTLADPSNPYSFLKFLAESGRIYRFISAGLPQIKRAEFDQYYRWVCDSLPNLHFSSPVTTVEHDGGGFRATVGGRCVRSRNLVLATGRKPRIPAFAAPYLGESIYHTRDFLDHFTSPAGRRIAIIGGGQSGAEVLRHLLSDRRELPDQVHWITLRSGLLPLDDSPFTEEIFTPAYSDFFFSLPAMHRERLLKAQRMASDGVSLALLRELYRRLYDLEFNEGAGRVCRIYLETELVALEPESGLWKLRARDRISGADAVLTVDQLVLATGYEYSLPRCIEPLRDRLELDGENLRFHDDFSIAWDGEADHKIYAQNAARHCRGVPDPNLSLMAWRSAKIVNGLVGRKVYDVREASSVFDWNRSPSDVPETAAALTHG